MVPYCRLKLDSSLGYIRHIHHVLTIVTYHLYGARGSVDALLSNVTADSRALAAHLGGITFDFECGTWTAARSLALSFYI